LRIFLSIVLVLSFLFCKGQDSLSALQAGKLRGILNSNGLQFDSLGNAGLLSNKLLSLCQRSGVWMSANDGAGQLRVSAHDVIGNNHEFWPGPLSIGANQAAETKDWNKVYKITKAEVESHKSNFNKQNYYLPDNMRNWPANANPPFAKILAPFVDYQTNDQVYRPAQGDYPYFKGDQLLYSIANDVYGPHDLSGALPLGIELHTLMYKFNSKDSVLKDAILIKYYVFNRSNNNYNNFRFSQIINFKIGSINNEFLGTDIKNNVFFAYNDTSEATFSNKLVSLGCMTINRPISSTIYFNNDNDAINGLPSVSLHFQNYQQAKWKNNSNMSYGSNGVDGNGVAKFVYPFKTDNNNSNLLWSEESVGNTSGKRQGVLNFEPIVLPSNTAAAFECVFFSVESNKFDIQQMDSTCKKLNNALKIQNVLDITKNVQNINNKFSFYPNILNSGEKMTFSGNIKMTQFYILYDLMGRRVLEFNLDETKNSINLPHYLKPGMYLIKSRDLNNNFSFKIIVE